MFAVVTRFRRDGHNGLCPSLVPSVHPPTHSPLSLSLSLHFCHHLPRHLPASSVATSPLVIGAGPDFTRADRTIDRRRRRRVERVGATTDSRQDRNSTTSVPFCPQRRIKLGKCMSIITSSSIRLSLFSLLREATLSGGDGSHPPLPCRWQ